MLTLLPLYFQMAGMQWGKKLPKMARGASFANRKHYCRRLPVSLDFRSRSRADSRWRSFAHWLRVLGSLGHRSLPEAHQLEPTANVPGKNQTGSSCSAAHTFDHVYLGRLVLRCDHVLALVYPSCLEAPVRTNTTFSYPSIQRVWARSCNGWTADFPGRLCNYAWSSYRALSAHRL